MIYLYHESSNHFRFPLCYSQLCFDLIKKWILENTDASICTAEGVDKFKDIAIYQDYHGLKEFREVEKYSKTFASDQQIMAAFSDQLLLLLQAVAKFMGRVGGNRVTFDPNRIVMSGGATGANETVMFCLADPGDAFLVPSPYYPGYILFLSFFFYFIFFLKKNRIFIWVLILI